MGSLFDVSYSTASSFQRIIPDQQETQTQFLIQQNGWDISPLVGEDKHRCWL